MPATINYQEYLASREWAVLREEVRKRSKNTCERCYKNPQQAVHHKTYERVGNEHMDDLQAICTPCHEFLSAKSHVDPVTKQVKVYLAGPITDEPWRAQVSTRPFPDPKEWTCGWPVSHNTLKGGFSFSGPFFSPMPGIDNAHGIDLYSGIETSYKHCGDNIAAQMEIVQKCCAAIRESDVIFAWLSKPDAYGTLWELGYASALGIKTYLAVPDGTDIWDNGPMWFPFVAPNTHYLERYKIQTIEEAWVHFQEQWLKDAKKRCGR